MDIHDLHTLIERRRSIRGYDESRFITNTMMRAVTAMTPQLPVSCRRLLYKAHMVEEAPAIETSLASADK